MSNIKEFLEKQKSKEGNHNLYEHLSNILGKILLDNPKNAYETFENLSHEVKDSGYKFKDHAAFESLPKMRESYEEIEAWATKARKLLDKMANEEGEDLGPCGYVPNLLDEMKKFEWAGIHFGEQETYLLQRSLTRLAHDTKAKSIRFWGKILGSDKDYFIAEVDTEGAAPEGGEPDPEGVPGLEARGTGINQLNYFVSNDVTGEWKALPIITPEQLSKARRIKHIFTGNLESDIVTNPPYKWKEKHYLKAQIARITHCTNIIPKGLWKIGADEEATEEDILNARDIVEEDEPKQATLEDLTNPANWQHYFPPILREGRVTYSEPPEDLEEEKKEAWEAARKKRDPYEKRLKPIALDKGTTGYKTAWSVKFSGDTIAYDTVSQKKDKTNYGVVVVKSLVWSGAVTIAYGKKWQSIYVGYGFKASTKPYYPILVQSVLPEPIDAPEQVEPQGEQEKPVDAGGDAGGQDDKGSDAGSNS